MDVHVPNARHVCQQMVFHVVADSMSVVDGQLSLNMNVYLDEIFQFTLADAEFFDVVDARDTLSDFTHSVNDRFDGLLVHQFTGGSQEQGE